MARDFDVARDFDQVREFDGVSGWPDLAGYQENFENPSSGGDSDPLFDDVVLLMHFNGANDGQVYSDVLGHVFTQNGFSSLSTANPKFGPSSYRNPHPVNGPGYLTTPSSADFAFGTGPFTTEFWVYPEAVSGTYFVLDMRGASGNIFAIVAGEAWWFAAGGFQIKSTGSKIPSGGAWYHIAYVRSGTGAGAVGELFVNGVSVGTWNDQTNYGSTGITIGGPADSPNSLQHVGDFDELRITAAARYTAPFTPTGPFPSS